MSKKRKHVENVPDNILLNEVLQDIDKDIEWLIKRIDHARFPIIRVNEHNTITFLSGVFTKLYSRNITKNNYTYQVANSIKQQPRDTLYMASSVIANIPLTHDEKIRAVEQESEEFHPDLLSLPDLKKKFEQKVPAYALVTDTVTVEWMKHTYLQKVNNKYDPKTIVNLCINLLQSKLLIGLLNKKITLKNNVLIISHRDKIYLFTHLIYIISAYGTRTLGNKVQDHMVFKWCNWVANWYYKLTSTTDITKNNTEILHELCTCLIIFNKRNPNRFGLPCNFIKTISTIVIAGRENRITGYYVKNQVGISKEFEDMHTHLTALHLILVFRSYWHKQ
jgi:hypothetical protein